MAGKKIVWDAEGERLFETGVDRGVLYPINETGAYGIGVPWNGLTSVSESPEGGEPNPIYADNQKYLNLISVEEAKGTIEAFTYPEEFAECDGSKELAPGVFAGQQNRTPFGLSYRTLVGNDIKGNDYGYKIHLVYGATAQPSEKSYETVNDSPEPAAFSWEYSTSPVTVPGMKPTATLTIDSTKVTPAALLKLEEALYGSETKDPAFPLPTEVIALVTAP